MKPPRKRWPKGTWMRLKSGKLLRGQMDVKHLSNADLAMAAGVGRTFISALVNGRRNSCKPIVAQRIAERLGIDLELLFEPRTSAVSSSSDKTQEKVA